MRHACILAAAAAAAWAAPAGAQTSAADPQCGNGYCDAWDGESCSTCAVDCCRAPAALGANDGDRDRAVSRWGRTRGHGWAIGADASVNVLVGAGMKKMVGGGADGRVGHRFDLGPVWITPEAVVGFVGFDDDSMKVGRAGIGVRLGLDRLWGLVEPAVFSHGGGWFHVGGGGPGLDLGGALDVRIGRRAGVGVHAAYDRAWVAPLWSHLAYASIGLHAGLML